MELFREVVPGLRLLAMLGNVDNPSNVLEMDEVQTAARRLGVEVAMIEIRRSEDVVPAFDTLKAARMRFMSPTIRS